jgi:hypothetical protein
MKVSTQGLGGGVSSHMRTGLDRKFPVIREFKREFEPFGPLSAGLRGELQAK